ncbi:hypothetical protein D1007_13591 [Hordeum vulgare]|nr:hypothetical protein D1007_13591 [Hordeum vulgare]
MAYPCLDFLMVAGIKDEFDNLCAAAGVRNVGKTTKMNVQPYEMKSLFSSLCSKDPREIHRGEISTILFPPIRYFAYYIARGVLARDNTSNISALDLAILAAALLGDNTYNIGALIARRLVAKSGKGPHFGVFYAMLILEHLGRTVRTDDMPFSFISFDLTAMKRHEFVTRTSEFGNLVYIMRFAELTTREIRLPAPLLSDYTSRNGWSFTSIELDKFVIQQQFHNPMEDIVPEEGEPSPWEEVPAASAEETSDQTVIEDIVASDPQPTSSQTIIEDSAKHIPHTEEHVAEETAPHTEATTDEPLVQNP